MTVESLKLLLRSPFFVKFYENSHVKEKFGQSLTDRFKVLLTVITKCPCLKAF